jgi:SAM-dependent methyltransferase
MLEDRIVALEARFWPPVVRRLSRMVQKEHRQTLSVSPYAGPMAVNTARDLGRRVVPLAVRRPVGIGLYRFRLWATHALEQSFGRMPLLASRDFVYGERFYATVDPMQEALYGRFVDTLFRLRSPSSVVDVGCGTGFMLSRFLEHGVRVLGVEGSRAAMRRADPTIRIVRANLERGVPNLGRFDVCLCVEVAEHLRAKSGPRLVEGLTRLSDTVVFTAATPGQGGTAHINERPVSYWRSLFAEREYAESPLRDQLLDEISSESEPWFPRRTLMVFEKMPRSAVGNGAKNSGSHA